MQLTLHDVGRIYDWHWAVKGINASWQAGEIIAILGSNGSGKSTLLRLLTGMLRPTQGRVALDGRTVRRGALSINAKMLLIEPDQRLLGSIASHFAIAITSYGQPDPEIELRFARWLERFDLLRSCREHQQSLSRGQRMKVWLATLFTLRPAIWILDEPHQSGLDAHGMNLLESEIRAHRESGGLVIFSTQYPPHANRLACQVMVLDQGKSVHEGSIASITENQGASSLPPSLRAVLDGLSGPQP